MERTFKGKLLEMREADFITYVFEDQVDNSIVIVTRLPNWQVPQLSIGAEGYVKVDEISAGELYIRPNGKKDRYTYSNRYFIDFVPIKERATTTFKL